MLHRVQKSTYKIGLFLGLTVLLLALVPLPSIVAQETPAQRVYVPLIQLPPAAEPFTLTAPETLDANVSQSIEVSASYLDETGQPVEEATVDFAANLGRFVNEQPFTSATTNGDGEVVVQFYGVPQLATTTLAAYAADNEQEVQVALVAGPCNDTEPNNVPAQAIAQPSAVCIGDFVDEEPTNNEGNRNIDDWYFIALDPEQSLSVTLTNIPSQADYDLFLFPSQGQLLASSTNGGSRSEALSYTNTLPQRELFLLSVVEHQEAPGDDHSYQMALVRDPLESIEEATGPLPVSLANAPAWWQADPVLPAKGAQ